MVCACDDDGKRGDRGTSCTVEANDSGQVHISCEDGTEATIDAPGTVGGDGGSCSVVRDDATVTITCPDGSSITFPVGSDSDGGLQACSVSKDDVGTVTITCPDGSSTTIPGVAFGDGGVSDAGPLPPDAAPGQPRVILTGATRAACGACHDSKQARAHFTAMTVEVDGELQETCGTCHNETSIEPVTRVHARPELGAPGFKVRIDAASVDAATRKTTVRLVLTDNADNPVTRDGVSWNFLVARVPPVTPAAGTGTIAGPYLNYLTRSVTQLDNQYYPLDGATPRMELQPTSERTGVFTEVGDGVYDYTFAAALPAPLYDPSHTHAVFLYATSSVDGVRFVANAEHFFVPNDAGATPLRREASTTATCNGCHNPLSAHGGSRQEYQLCLGCHTQGAKDPESNNSIDFNVMVHRIHMGAQLPSVEDGTPYRIIGNALSLHDFSEIGFPRPIQHCQSCHNTADDRWVTNGTREACTSCHDNIDEPAAEGGHPFTLNPNATCGNANCHGPGGNVPDAREAHVTRLNTDSAAVFDIEIVSIALDDVDAAPSVRVRARTGTRATGAVTPVTSADQLSLLNVFINGPNQSFEGNGNTIVQFAKADLVDLEADAAAPGEFTFTLPETLRQAVQGFGIVEEDSYTMTLRAQYDPTPGGAPDSDRVDMAKNPSMAFGAGDEVRARLAVVDTAKCNACHGELQAHGGANLAKNVEQCIMCHTATLDTRNRQGASNVAGPTTSLRFSTLIHRTHAGNYAEQPYVAYGFGAMPPYPEVDLSHIGFPGALNDCLSCHTSAATFTLPLPEGTQPSQTVTLDENGDVVTF